MERVKFNMEFMFRSSPAILYQFLTTPSCLIRWFSDGVDIQGDIYVFTWEGSTQEAQLLADVEEELIRFRWLDADDAKEFLEFKISTSPITDDTILEITDFSDEDELDDQKMLWDAQMERLRNEMGAGG
jgi:uncharacterized protein YndB with AHSA1/START domain